MKKVAIIQARMGSTRLPGKILKEVNSKPLLSYQLERLRESEYIDNLVIATTTESQDMQIVQFCEEYNVDYYRGSEQDVLSRYYEAAIEFDADIIIRITSDCPIIDTNVVDKTIKYFVEEKFDYVSNTIERTYPRGMDTEVFTLSALKKAYKEAHLARDREHVTAYFYTNPKLFKLGSMKNRVDYSKYRWTVDTIEDFELIQNLIQALYKENPHFTFEETVRKMEENPAWFDINAHIEQKKL